MPGTINVSLEDFAGELAKYAEASIDEFRAGVTEGVLMSMPDVVRASPVDTGLYAQSWDVEVQQLYVALGNSAPHSPIIEYGARPFRPPLAPLLQWAKRVLKDPSQPEGDGYSDSVWALAIYVQKKIEREGMAPKAVLQNALPGIIENIRAALGRRFG